MRPRCGKSLNGFYQYFFSDPHIKAVTSTRVFNAGFEDRTPDSNRSKIFESLSISPKKVVGGIQVHNNHVQLVFPEDVGGGALSSENAFQGTDGFVTGFQDIALTMQTADCVPLFIVDSKTSALCLLHCGWKSLKQRIIAVGIAILRDVSGSRPKDFEVVIGPCLQASDFEVGLEFEGYFPGYIVRNTEDGRLKFDVNRFILDQLKRESVLEENILDTKLSTLKNHFDFYSYRREGEKNGRMLSLLGRI